MKFRRARLVPELLVTDLVASKRFWIEICGFSLAYGREKEGFVYLDLDGAQVMLVEVRGDGYWVTAPLDAPRGRGMNLEIKVPAVEPIVDALTAANWPLFEGVTERWYRHDDMESGVREFLVQDPDGYLLRFSALMDERPSAG
ncbi:bleomycin resistance protein [Achromobacter aloeverae]